MATAQDRAHLRRACELAARGLGRVSPNPPVGAVVVRDAEVIGEGWHAEIGGVHAEVAALADCRERGEDPEGATVYVSLEPCAHQGRQPPCTDALLAAGVTRVVIGCDDPSEKAAGRGPGNPSRRGHRGGLRRRRRGGRGAASGATLSKARSHRPAAGDAESGDQPGRVHGDHRGGLEVDLRAREPSAGASLARGGRCRCGRDRDGAGRRPVAHGARRGGSGCGPPAGAGRLRLCRPAAVGLRARPVDRRGTALRVHRGRSRSARESKHSERPGPR